MRANRERTGFGESQRRCQTERNKHQGNGEADTDETDGEKTGQDTSRQTEGTGRCYHHIWMEKRNQEHANHSV